MNIKKLVITGAAAALLLGTAAGAFANHDRNDRGNGGVSVSNSGSISNTSWNVANTGLNFVSGGSDHNSKPSYDYGRRGDDKSSNSGPSVTTGDATAVQSVWNEIDTLSSCGCSTSDSRYGRDSSNGSTSVRNSGDISNLSVNVANSGANFVGGGTLHTGDAQAGQDVTNYIVTGIGSF